MVALTSLSPACRGGSKSLPAQRFVTRAAIVSLASTNPVLAQAEAQLTAKCMRLAGFYYPLGNPLAGELQAGRSLFGFAGKLTVLGAQAHGYGQEIHGTSGSSPERALSKYLAALSADGRNRFYEILAGPQSAYTRVRGLDGVVVKSPTQGCVSAARKAVYGSVENFILIARFPAYLFGYGSEIYEDSRFQSAQTLYASCMKGAGYDVSGTGEAIDLARVRFGTSPAVASRNKPMVPESSGAGLASSSPGAIVSDDERRMAVTDATCQQSSGIYASWDEAGFAAASSWIDRNAVEILTLRRIQLRSIGRANRLLAT